jgi:hypothetical protein
MRSRTAVLLAVSAMGCRQLLDIGTPISDDGGEPTDAARDAATDAHADAPSSRPIFVQAGSITGTAGVGSELAVDLDQPLVTNDVLVVAVGAEGSGTITFAVTDTAGTMFVAGAPEGGFQVLNAEMFYGEVVAGSATDDVSVTFAGSASALDVRVVQYRNLATATAPVALDSHVSHAGSGLICTATVSVGSGGGLVVAADYSGTPTLAAGNGFTRRITSSPDHGIVEDDYVDAQNVVIAECTLAAAAPWAMQALVFGVP